MHGSFTEQEMLSLYNPRYIDCYVTATHGEGFGIPLFNAACSGIPVIATNWSGHLDFLRAPFKSRTGKTKYKSHFLKVNYDLIISEGCIWAYPQEESFRKNIRFIRKNSHSFLEDSNNLRQHLENNYSINEIKNKYQLFMGKIVEDCIDYYNQEQSWDDDTEEDGFLGKI
jgi:glycosyltransferase involved in cell wall biosynthesis